jgi:putative sigma-54 modulation protein
MQVQVTGHHVEITPGIRSFIEVKCAKLEELYPDVRKVAVIISVEKYRHTAEIHFHADKVEMSAKKTTKDMYASIEEAIAALEQQAGKRKDRLHTSGALRRTKARVEKLRSRTSKAQARDDEDAAPAKPRVVKVRNEIRTPLSVDDAVAALEGSDKGFLLFREKRGAAVQLLFKRDDGSYGLLEA